MKFDLMQQLKTFGTYFLIALAAEMAGFVGWMNEMTKGGDVFQLSSAFWAHEVSRLRVWLPVFIGLSAVRFLATSTMRRLETKRLNQS